MGIIDKLYKEHSDLRDKLIAQGEVSFLTTVEEDFRKVLLLSVASYFEELIVAAIEGCVAKHSKAEERVVSFVRNTAIVRKYHTYFQWNDQNVNYFLGLFGQKTKDKALKLISSDDSLKNSIRDFLELGRLRNHMVHGNFASYYLEKTPQEVYQQYISAAKFINFVERLLN